MYIEIRPFCAQNTNIRYLSVLMFCWVSITTWLHRVTEWLSPQSGCQLFWIIWRRWGRTYQLYTYSYALRHFLMQSRALTWIPQYRPVTEVANFQAHTRHTFIAQLLFFRVLTCTAAFCQVTISDTDTSGPNVLVHGGCCDSACASAHSQISGVELRDKLGDGSCSIPNSKSEGMMLLWTVCYSVWVWLCCNI